MVHLDLQLPPQDHGGDAFIVSDGNYSIETLLEDDKGNICSSRWGYPGQSHRAERPLDFAASAMQRPKIIGAFATSMGRTTQSAAASLETERWHFFPRDEILCF